MDKKYLEICSLLKEFTNCSASIGAAYESPARPWKKPTETAKEKKTNWVSMKKGTGLINTTSGKNKKKGY